MRDVAGRWEQFVEYLCLGLGQDLGRDVRPVRPRKQTAAMRLEANCAALAENGTLEAAIRVPDAVGPLVVQAELRTRKAITSVVVEAPGEGRPSTRVNWLLRQLKERPTAWSSTRASPTRTFAPSESYPYGERKLVTSEPLVEVTVLYSVPDVRDFVLTVNTR